MLSDLEQAVVDVESGNATLIDVRTHNEHQQQSARQAIHIDLSEIESGSDPELDKDAIIYIHCQSGGRAGIACTLLTARGYTRIQNVGGLSHWLDAGGTAN